MPKPSRKTFDLENELLLTQIIWTVPKLYHSLTATSERTYAKFGLTAGKRSLLRDLTGKGPHTIAEMVRERPPVTRQYIQRLISELSEIGYVVLEENPADKRSKIVHLTKKGTNVIGQLVPAEKELINQLLPGLKKGNLLVAKTVLEALAEKLDVKRQ